MKRKITRTPVDYGKFLIKIRLEEEETTNLTALGSNPRQSMIDLLNVIIHDPSQVEHGEFKPSKIELFNEDGKWVLISTVTEVV